MSRVAIVLKEIGPEQLRELLRFAHVWLIELPGNVRIARELQKEARCSKLDGELTGFTPVGATPHEHMRAALELVEAHHNGFVDGGAWDELELIGAPTGDGVQELLAQYGASQCRITADAIFAVR